MAKYNINNPHPSVTLERIMPMVEDQMFGMGNPGICVACGDETDGCEPDARNYECHSCGEHEVYGAEWIFVGLV